MPVFGKLAIYLKLNIHLPYDPVIPLLVIYPKEKQQQQYMSIQSHIQMLVVVLFIITKN